MDNSIGPESAPFVPTSAHPAAAARLLEQYRPYLKEFADGRFPEWLKTRLDPSDLVQEALLRGCDRAGQFQGSTELEYRAWLRELLEHLIIDAMRHHGRSRRAVDRERRLPESLPCPHSDPASVVARRAEARGTVQWALSQLPAEYRQVVLLRQEREWTFAEIGREIGKTADATRMLWGRAILELGKLLKANGDG